MPVIIATLILAAAFGVGTFVFRNKDTVPDTSSLPIEIISVETASSSAVAEEPVAHSAYADGTYHGTGTYTSPAGTETVDVSLTLQDDTVTAATFEGHPTNPGTVMNQGKFARGYTAFVVGKKLDEISLTVVNGSSLTPIGFMNALEEIKTEARS
jgi:hypothetical protein